MRWILVALVTVFLPLIVSIGGTGGTASVPTPEPTAPTAVTLHCLALGEPWKHWPVIVEVADKMGLDCYHNWYAGNSPLKEDKRYTPAIYDLTSNNPGEDYVRDWAEAEQGRTWLLLNEPELLQIDPVQAAAWVQRWSDAIKGNGVIACCGSSQQFWPLSNPWLEAYLAAGGPVPDVWHIHIYAGDMQEWWYQFDRFDAWNVGDRRRPVIVSETGIGPEVWEAMSTLHDERILAIYWFTYPGVYLPPGLE